MFHEQARKGGAGEGGPFGRSGPLVRTVSESGAIALAKHKAVSMGMAVDVEHEAASMLDYSLSPYSRLMRLVSTPSRASSSM